MNDLSGSFFFYQRAHLDRPHASPPPATEPTPTRTGGPGAGARCLHTGPGVRPRKMVSIWSPPTATARPPGRRHPHHHLLPAPRPLPPRRPWCPPLTTALIRGWLPALCGGFRTACCQEHDGPTTHLSPSTCPPLQQQRHLPEHSPSGQPCAATTAFRPRRRARPARLSPPPIPPGRIAVFVRPAPPARPWAADPE